MTKGTPIIEWVKGSVTEDEVTTGRVFLVIGLVLGVFLGICLFGLLLVVKA